MKSVRIGAGQGFWGDSPYPALDIVKKGNVRYLACDALAELTMAILQKARQKDPSKGYVVDGFFDLLLRPCSERGIKILTNAGGINPVGCGRMVYELARKMGLKGLKIAVVTGDDVLAGLAGLQGAGVSLSDMESGGSISDVWERILFANVYLGAKPLVDALESGADVVITGRTADPALFLAPMVFELGWRWDDWDSLALGILLGHLMECSAQSTGGNFSGDWWNIPDMERIGYPVAEVFENAEAVLTKAEGTGGRVDLETVKEQMLYEIHDPTSYVTPDVIADFTSACLVPDGLNRVKISGMRGKPRPETLKLCAGYADGWLGDVSMRYCWPHALKKARKAEEIIKKQFSLLDLKFEEILVEYIGHNSLLGPLARGDGEQLNEVGLRIAVRTRNKREAERLPRLMPPLALNGPPGVSGFGGITPPRELIGLWSALVPRGQVEKQVKVDLMEVN